MGKISFGAKRSTTIKKKPCQRQGPEHDTRDEGMKPTI